MINHHLGAVGRTIFFRVEVVEDAVYHVQLFSNAAAMMQELEGLTNVKGHRNWRDLKREISATELIKSLALEAKVQGVQYLLHLWKEAGALQAVREDLASEFEGEDPLLPEPRNEAEETRRRLLAAADALGVRRRLVDGDGELVGLYQAEVNESFRRLSLVEPYA